MFTVGIITMSDKGFRGEREDKSGPLIAEMIRAAGKYQVIAQSLIADDKQSIQEKLIHFTDDLHADLILTTGGTGFSERDIAPEATLSVADREAPGIAEAIRAYSMGITKRAMLSRGVSVIRKKTLIVNLPGSPKAVEESLSYILPELEHGLAILTGSAGECGREK